MTDRLTVGQLMAGHAAPAARTQAGAKPGANAAADFSFRQVLDRNLLTFSHHAEMRLKQRGLQLNPEQLSKLNDAVNKASAKGAKESLVVMNNLALIVNIKSKTVVTALDNAMMKNNVFTQIDSAVFVD